jgi:hypothetical protein
MLIKNSEKPLIKVKIKRLPYARCILISGITNLKDKSNIDHENKTADILYEKFGLKLKSNTSKIESIKENSIFYQAGLKYDPNRVEFDILMSKNNNCLKIEDKDRLTKWVITEINGYHINYKLSSDEVQNLFLLK